jgi:hypothetical protein
MCSIQGGSASEGLFARKARCCKISGRVVKNPWPLASFMRVLAFADLLRNAISKLQCVNWMTERAVLCLKLWHDQGKGGEG